MITLDASVLIAHLDDSDAHHNRAYELLCDLAEESWVVNTLTAAEVLVGPAQSNRLHDATAALKRLGIWIHGIEQDSAARLAELRATTGLRMPDVCVLLTAESTDAAVATFDSRLADVARSQGRTVHR